MSAKTVTITKVGDTPPPPVVKKETPIAPPVVAGRKKTVKTFPRGVLKKTAKILPVRDPAKAPAMRKHTLKLLTDKGMRTHRKTLKRKIAKLSDAKVKDVIQKAGLVKSANVPPAIARQILDSAAGAGFVSV
jgi:hypothetical protein